jgi:5-methylcytosine-specific restriction protein A
MPRRPKTPCRYPGCPELVAGRYCEKHQKQEYSNYNKYRREAASKKRYGRTWKKLRNYFIALHPWCEMCLNEGRHTLAEEVHHIKPLGEGGDNSMENLMSLCKHHHSRVTRQADMRRRKNNVT